MPVDTGNLIGSVKITEINKGRLRIAVGTDVEYAIYIEEGTRFQPAQKPFEIGSERALKIIMIVIDEILEEEIDLALMNLWSQAD